jgi:hypothetical protein
MKAYNESSQHEKVIIIFNYNWYWVWIIIYNY